MHINWPHKTKTIKVNGKVVYHPIYFRWRSMKARCTQPSSSMYYLYGARGIKVCKEWLDFWTFASWVLKNYEPNKTIDRIDNDGDYSPKNCKWSTAQEQMNNIRVTDRKRNATKKALAVLAKNPHLRTKNSKRCKVTGRFI